MNSRIQFDVLQASECSAQIDPVCTEHWWLFVWAHAVESQVEEGSQLLPHQGDVGVSVTVVYESVRENPTDHKDMFGLLEEKQKNIHIIGCFGQGGASCS